MSRFLRLGAFLSVLFFATNVFASGYTCPSYKRYTSCNEGYYLNGTKAGNSCELCPSGCACSGGTAQPDCTISVTYNLNGGSGTTPSATQCTSGVSCSLQSGATTSFYRAGYVFKGWSTSSSATSGSTSITVTASTTVYAIWSKCDAGTYKTSSEQASASCSICPAGSYCPAGAGVATACSTLAGGFYPSSAPRSDAATDCKTNLLSGKYVASANATGATSCAAGTFKGAHQVYYGSTSSCDACALGSYSAAGASACTACQNGKTTSGVGQTSCNATCANNNSYDSAWATATWSDNAVANLCKITTCAGGSRYTSAKGEAAGTLPSGYTQLAYLESTGTQAIDTKTVLQTDNVEFEWTAVDKSTASYTTLFGSETSSNPKYTGILHGSNTSRSLYYGSITGKGVGYSAGAELARWKLLLADTVKLYKNDVMVSSELAASSLQKSLPIAVFASNLRGSMGQFSSVQMYSFKIWDGGNLVLNLIPAKRDSDGVLGMYDTVNNRFLVNAGSGTFVAGPIILKSQNTCTQCAAGTYSAGGTATSCGTCANWTYSSAGATSCTACLAVPDAVGGVAWTKATGTGWTSFNKCVVSQTPVNCASGSVKRTQSSATAWGSTTLVSALKSKAGYYASTTATSCTICPAGSYCAANATAATDCPGSMTSDTGSDAITDCKISCDAGYMLAAGASTCTACSGGYYCESGATYNYNATAIQGRTDKVTAGYYSSGGGLSATGTCLSGYSCGSCSTGTGANGRLLYSDAGAASCSECPAATGTLANRVTSYSGWWSNNIHNKITGCYANFSDSDDTATFRTLCYYNATDGTYGGANSSCQIYAPTECAGGYRSVIESAAEWYGSYAGCRGADCMKGKVCGLTDAGYYSPAGATTQTACAIGSYTNATGKSACTACSAGKTTTGTGKTSCDATCNNATGVHTWAIPRWSANSVTNLCAVSKCNANTYYTATTGTGYKNTCTACGSNSSTSAGNTSTTCTCTTGYTSTGSVSGATTSTSGCSLISDIACAIGEYVPASSTSCSACTAGYYCPSTARTYSYSSSIQGRTACSAGTYQPNTGKTSCTPASKGYYVSGTAKTAQTACSGATYQNETGKTSCKSCPTGYTANTASAKIAASQCQISCAAGTQVATANAQCTTPSGNWYTTASQLVNYGSTSSVSSCPTGTITLTADMLEQGGIVLANGTMSYNTIRVRQNQDLPLSPGTYNINVPSNSGIKVQSGFLWNMDGTFEKTTGSTFTVTADRLFRLSFAKTDTSAEIAVADVVNAGVTISKQYTISGTGATNHDDQSDCQIVSPAGTYVAGTGKMFQACVAGAYKSSAQTLNYGSTNSCSVCGTNTYSNAGASSCSACATDKGYTNSGTSASNHAGMASCKATCGAGQYVATAGSACVNVGAGYYATGGTVAQGATSSRSQCTSPLTTIGYGTGANEAEDCGRKLHAGANVIYLRSAARTSPSLRVKVGDTTFYGALSTSLSSPVKVKNGSTTYSVVNDWQ